MQVASRIVIQPSRTGAGHFPSRLRNFTVPPVHPADHSTLLANVRHLYIFVIYTADMDMTYSECRLK
jgi:hypothetical protein